MPCKHPSHAGLRGALHEEKRVRYPTQWPGNLRARQRTGLTRAIHHPPNGRAHSGKGLMEQAKAASEAFESLCFHPFDPPVLAVCVGIAVVRMLRGAACLHLFIFEREVRPRPEIVPEREVPANGKIAVRVAMEMDLSKAAVGIRQHAEPPTFQAEFPVPGKAQRLEVRTS